MKMIKTYSYLKQLPTFEERFDYCRCPGKVGTFTFGSERYANQRFYTSELWKRIRREVILRDNGCDLGVNDGNHEIPGKITIHHLVPITIDDIINQTDFLINPEYMVCVSDITHKAIHYSDAELLPKGLIERSQNDTCPWRF